MSLDREPRDRNTPAAAYIGGHGSTLLLLHGFGATWAVWKPVLAALESRHRVIAMTLPGHHGGPAYAGSGDATVAGLADQVIATMHSEGITSAHVAGNSLGGWLSLELARRGFAQSVVAFSPAGGWRAEAEFQALADPFRILYRWIRVLLFLVTPFAGFASLRKMLSKQAMEHGDRVPEEDFRASLRAISMTPVMPGVLRTGARDGPIAPLQAGNLPIRIVWAECDRVIPYSMYGEPLVERVDGADLRFIAGVGHVPMYDDPRSVVNHIFEVTAAADAAVMTTEGAAP